MPVFNIHIVNSDFESSHTIDVESPDEARSEALKGALQIGSDEVRGGSAFFGAELRVELGEEVVARMMVAIGATPLK